MSEPLFDREFLRKLEYLNLLSKRLVFGRQQALRQSVKKGASLEFREFREYVPGDDPRSIDWTVLARLNELVVKLFRHEEELHLWVLLDASRSMDFGEPNKFDVARRIAAALAYIGLCNMDSASVVPFSRQLRPGLERMRGRGRVFQMLEHLTDLRADDETDLPRCAQEFVSRVRRPGLVVVLSDLYGLAAGQAALDRLRFFRHELFVIPLADRRELSPELRGELRLFDCETGGHRDLVVTESLLKKYRRRVEESREELRRYCMRYSIGHAPTTTDVPFDEFLRKVLETGGLVA